MPTIGTETGATVPDAVKIDGVKKPKKLKPLKPAKKAKARSDPAKLDPWGFRKGSAKAKAAALYHKGATLQEVAAKIGRVMFNIITELETKKGFKLKRETEVCKKTGRECTRYTLPMPR